MRYKLGSIVLRKTPSVVYLEKAFNSFRGEKGQKEIRFALDTNVSLSKYRVSTEDVKQ